VILPTKGLDMDRALVAVGGEILRILDRPKTVSRIWEELGSRRSRVVEGISFDWFVLALDLLFLLEAVYLRNGRLTKAKPVSKS